MVRAGSTYRREKRDIQRFWYEKLKGREHLNYLGVGVRKILK